MQQTEYFEPRSHLIIRHFLTREEEAKLWKEIELFKGFFKPNPNNPNNDSVFPSDIHPDIFDTVTRSLFFNKILFNREFTDSLAKLKSPWFESLSYTTHDITKISCYGDGQFYPWHTDIHTNGMATLLLTLCSKPKQFEGGELVLRYDGIEKEIPFENNSLIIFSKSTDHKVNKIILKDNEFLNKRFSIQCFLNMKNF